MFGVLGVVYRNKNLCDIYRLFTVIRYMISKGIWWQRLVYRHKNLWDI